MQKKQILLSLISLIVLLSGCTNTFMGTVLILTFSDVILYVIIAFIVSILIALFDSENSKRSFWIGFILSLLLTPVAGFIYLLIKVTNRK